MRAQGDTGVANVATVSDADQAANTLVVTATSIPAGLSISGLAISPAGNVTATVAAACDATFSPKVIALQVTDAQGNSASTNLPVNVTANVTPTLGSYAATRVNVGGTVTVTPDAPPMDGGTVTTTATSFFPFTGTLTVDQLTGAVTITNARPVGTFAVEILATDSCGAFRFRQLTLRVNNVPSIVAGGPFNRTQGSTARATIANVSDVNETPGSLTATATGMPAGLTVNAVTNDAGEISAEIGVACAAPIGPQTFTLEVRDGLGDTATAPVTVNVSAYVPLSIGNYANSSVRLSGAVMILPTGSAPAEGTLFQRGHFAHIHRHPGRRSGQRRRDGHECGSSGKPRNHGDDHGSMCGVHNPKLHLDRRYGRRNPRDDHHAGGSSNR